MRLIFIFNLLFTFTCIQYSYCMQSPKNNKHDRRLLRAIQQLNFEKAKEALKHSADSRTKLFGKPILHYVLHSEPLVSLLLEYGACPNDTTNEGITALQEAARQGDSHIISALLKHKATLRNYNNAYGPLDYAVLKNNIRCLKILLKELRIAGLDIVEVQNILFEALFVAACTRNIRAAELLFRELADLNITFETSGNFLQAFLRAISEGLTELIPHFIKLRIVLESEEPETGKTALHIALKDKQEQSVRSLISWGLRYITKNKQQALLAAYFTELHDASLLEEIPCKQSRTVLAHEDDEELEQQPQNLLQELPNDLPVALPEELQPTPEISNLNEQPSGITQKSTKDLYSFEFLLRAIFLGNFKLVYELLSMQKLSFQQAYDALMRVNFVLELLDDKLSIESATSGQPDQNTLEVQKSYKALHKTLHVFLYGSELFRWFTRGNAEPNVIPLFKILPDEIWGHILSFIMPGVALLDYPKQSARLYQAISEDSVLLAREFIKKGAEVKSQDGNQDTPLHMAATRGNQTIIELLLAHGALVKVENKQNKTPEDVARENKHEACAEYLKAAAENYIPETALIRALRKQRSKKKIKKLLREGCEVNFADYRRNALDVAESVQSSLEIMQLLIKHGAVCKTEPKTAFWVSGRPNLHALHAHQEALEQELVQYNNDLTSFRALSYAVTSGKPAVVKLLLEKAKPGYDHVREAYKIAQAISKRTSLTEEQLEEYDAIKIALLTYAGTYSMSLL